MRHHRRVIAEAAADVQHAGARRQGERVDEDGERPGLTVEQLPRRDRWRRRCCDTRAPDQRLASAASARPRRPHRRSRRLSSPPQPARSTVRGAEIVRAAPSRMRRPAPAIAACTRPRFPPRRNGGAVRGRSSRGPPIRLARLWALAGTTAVRRARGSLRVRASRMNAAISGPSATHASAGAPEVRVLARSPPRGTKRSSPASFRRLRTVWMAARSFEYFDRSTPMASSRSRTSMRRHRARRRRAATRRQASVSPSGTVGIRPIRRESVPIVCASCGEPVVDARAAAGRALRIRGWPSASARR